MATLLSPSVKVLAASKTFVDGLSSLVERYHGVDKNWLPSWESKKRPI
jgi:hypothetical protein